MERGGERAGDDEVITEGRGDERATRERGREGERKMHVSSSSMQKVRTSASSGWTRWKRLMLLSKSPICAVEKTFL
jgi:hypothetical protein